MEIGLAKQDILPSLHCICKTGNEKERTHFLVPNCSSFQSPALVLCREVFAKALLIYCFVDVSEAYRFFLHLCTKHILDCHGFCGLSWAVGLYGGSPRSFIKQDLEEVFEDISVQELVCSFPNKVSLSSNLALMTFLSMQATTTLFHGMNKVSLQWKLKIALTYSFLIVMYFIYFFI